MPTYILLSKLTDDGAATLRKNPGRVQEVNREIEKLGVKVREQYAVLGPYDFVNVVDAPDTATITRVSIELGARGSVQITTLAAIPLNEFVGALES
ncbi:MAG: GYD domain-containing protein [Gemmatimonadetes bacterium]|nr:GYD domain-containing protein [Gemmatimonadota bacterium]